jgi:carbamoyltransferase
MKSVVIGVNDEHDAGCALIVDGTIVAAYEEERFSRVKQHNGQTFGLPAASLSAILDDYNLQAKDITYISANFPKGIYLMRQIYKDLWRQRCMLWWFAPLIKRDFHGIGDYIYPFFYVWRKRLRLKRFLKKCNLHKVPIVYTDHHVAHAASAFYTSGLKNALVVTLDGQGSGLSGSISLGKEGVLRRRNVISKYDSVGLLYSTVTNGLGFKAGRHEGKILGLAAYGDSKRFYERLKKMIRCEGLDINLSLMRRYPSPIYPNFISTRKVFNEAFAPWAGDNREDLSAALQRRTEEVIVELVENAVSHYGMRDVVVAGGVFANVKANQRIWESAKVDSLHVYPAMSDAGLAAGSALHTYYTRTAPKKGEISTRFNDAYLGKAYSDSAIVEELEHFDIHYKKSTNIEAEVAHLLNMGKVVARFNGRCEYGPRALGNRSVLYNGRDKKANDWLNKKLDRTEFMPFAPSTLEEDAHLYYKGVEKGNLPKPGYYMTITFDCREKMIQDCQAAVHVDNTARPQFVSQKTNPSYHKIIKEYKKLSGSGTVVNTSFNVHEEPIVLTPKDAIRSFLITRLDALAIGDYLVLRSDL